MLNMSEKEHFAASAQGRVFFRAGVEILRCYFFQRSYMRIKYYIGNRIQLNTIFSVMTYCYRDFNFNKINLYLLLLPL